eukprot:768094-Hanusia_phi.AAC.2
MNRHQETADGRASDQGRGGGRTIKISPPRQTSRGGRKVGSRQTRPLAKTSDGQEAKMRRESRGLRGATRYACAEHTHVLAAAHLATAEGLGRVNAAEEEERACRIASDTAMVQIAGKNDCMRERFSLTDTFRTKVNTELTRYVWPSVLEERNAKAPSVQHVSNHAERTCYFVLAYCFSFVLKIAKFYISCVHCVNSELNTSLTHVTHNTVIA